MRNSFSIFILFLSVIQAVPEFRNDENEFLEVGFTKKRTGIKVSELTVTVMDKEMFDGGEIVDMDDISIEVKSGEGCWAKVDKTPTQRGRDKLVWKVMVIPCEEHLVRIAVKMYGCVKYFQYPRTIAPATPDHISKSKFRPKQPENLYIHNLSADSVVVSWSPSACAESYQLWYDSHDGDDSGNITVSAGVESVTVRELKNCTDYTLYITAMVGENIGEEAEVDFTTCSLNSTKTPDTIDDTQNDISDLYCETIDQECEIELLKPSEKFENISSTDMEVLSVTDIEMATENITQFEIQNKPEPYTSQAGSVYNMYNFLKQIIVIVVVIYI